MTRVAVADGRIRDLRGGTVRGLRYPPDSVLVVAGIPGAGKTTLLRRLYGLAGRERAPVRTPDGVLVLDSEQARNHWAARLARMPYRYWRPLVHLTHYLRLWHALGQDGPVVVHDCGTRTRMLALIARRAAHRRHDLHVILVDTPPALAYADARNRPRPLNTPGFHRHARRWQHLLARLANQPYRVLPHAHSITVLDRAAAGQLSTLDFPADAGAYAPVPADPPHGSGTPGRTGRGPDPRPVPAAGRMAHQPR